MHIVPYHVTAFFFFFFCGLNTPITIQELDTPVGLDNSGDRSANLMDEREYLFYVGSPTG